MLPSATDLEYFLEVSRTLNISRAAERIGISQPTLTQSIHKLESAVGAQLLIRTRTGVRLTKPGLRISGQIMTLLESWASLQKEAQQDEHELQGKFRLGVHPSVARYTLPKFFKELSRRAPRIEIELVHDLSRHITESIINFKVDLGLVINPANHPDLVLRKICDDHVTVFQSRHRTGKILFGDPDLAQTQWILKRLKRPSLDFTHFVPTPNLEVVQCMVASGAGYGVLPTRVAQSEGGHQLTVVDAKLPAFKDELFVAYRKEVMTSRAAKTLIEIAKDCL
ncbi:LysR family transcriptional regulator [Bdellovibrio bacteriovorus]|uniref:LysR family transcriptional regulator n=1 Tax=Bdellovibrio bacteriovorus TaxID=959 RepID=UPI0021D01C6C|nr:LysR family transcriptional regulator [Bdellovibrio bacteriovorus]UXR65302.1 LysR family transcriptional regulator [Bdellovibrio bacteriovorus]